MKLIKIGISGCLGRMGKELVAQTKNKRHISFVGGFDLKDKKTSLNDIFGKADVVIDFSTNQGSSTLIKHALSHSAKLVICSTGLDAEQMQYMKENIT